MKNELHSLNEDQQELIYKYYEGSLSKAANKAFEENMRHEAFRQAVRLHGQLQQVFHKELDDDELRGKVKAAAKRYHQSSVGIKQRQPSRLINLQGKRTLLAMAAAIIALIVFGTVIWANLNYSNSAIVQSFQEPLFNNITKSQITQDDIFYSGREDFFKEQYPKAEAAMLNISSENKNYPEAQAILAYCAFYQKKYEAALPYFDKLLDEYYEQLPEHYKNREKLRWSRLMVLLGLGQHNNASFQEEIQFFIHGKSAHYREKAKQLQKVLQSPLRKITFD